VVLLEHTYVCAINGLSPMHSCLYVKLVSGAGVFTVRLDSNYVCIYDESLPCLVLRSQMVMLCTTVPFLVGIWIPFFRKYVTV
jgi:hypothetical protein